MLLRPFTQLRDRPRGSVNLGPNRLGTQWLHQTRKVMAKYGESQTCKASRWASVQKWTMFGGSGIPNFDRDVDKCSKPSCSFRPRSSLDLCGTFAPELCDPKSIGAHQKSGQCSSKLVVWDKSRSGQSRGQLICVYIYMYIYIIIYIYICIYMHIVIPVSCCLFINFW